MPRRNINVEEWAPAAFKWKAAGETNQQFAESYGLTVRRIMRLVTRQNRKRKKVDTGYVLRTKGRPGLEPQTQKPHRDRRFANCG